MSSIKKLGNQIIVYGLGHFIARFINFTLLPLYTHRFNPQDYGVITLVFAFIAFSSVLFTYGMDVAFMRFYGMEKKTKDKQMIFSTSFISILISTFFIGGLYFYFSDKIASFTIGIEYKNLIQLSVGILSFDALIALPKILLRLQDKPYHFIFLELSHVLLVLVLNIWWIGIKGFGVDYIFISNLIASGFVFILCIPFIINSFQIKFTIPRWNELIIFALPYIPAGLANLLNELVDRYMIKWMVDENAVGLYSSSYKLGIFMLIVIMAFKFAWQPFYLKEADNKDAPILFAKVGTYFLLVMFFLFLSISFFINEFVQIPIFGRTIIHQNYWDSLNIIPVVLLAYIILGVFIIQLPGIYIKKKNLWIPVLNGSAAIINIITNIILIPLYGYKSAAVATLLSYSAMVILQYIIVKQFYPIKWEWWRIVSIVLVTGILFFIWKWCNESFLIGIINIAIYPTLFFIIPFFSSSEKKYIRSFLFIEN